MNFLLQSILSYLLIYKYAALFAVTFLAALALPIPAAATVIASAAFASQGYLNMPLVLITASLGNVAGDNLGYWLARRFGRPVLYKIGFGKIFNSPVFQAIERQIELRPALIVFFSRFEVLATLSVNILAGLSKMPYISYIMFEVPGEVVQILVFASLGYFFGNSWERVNSLLGKFSLAIALLLILAAAIIVKRVAKRLPR